MGKKSCDFFGSKEGGVDVGSTKALFFVSNAWYKQRERKGGIRSKILPIKYILYEHREVCRQATLNNYTIYNNKPISLSLSLLKLK